MDIKEIDKLTGKIIGLAIEVHRRLGPGLLESVYRQCLAYEFSKNGIDFVMEQPIPIKYKEIKIDCGFRADFIVADCIIVELKAVERVIPIHEAQLMTYLKVTKLKVGLLMNFNVRLLRKGIKRFIL